MQDNRSGQLQQQVAEILYEGLKRGVRPFVCVLPICRNGINIFKSFSRDGKLSEFREISQPLLCAPPQQGRCRGRTQDFDENPPKNVEYLRRRAGRRNWVNLKRGLSCWIDISHGTPNLTSAASASACTCHGSSSPRAKVPLSRADSKRSFLETEWHSEEK